MRSARDEILGRIRSAVGDVAPPQPPPRAAATREIDVVALFVERVADYDVVVRTAHPYEIGRAVAAVCGEHAVRRAAVAEGLPESWLPDEVELVRDDGLSYEVLDGLDCAITGCALAIAETGTIVLDHGSGQGRRALTLIPDLHICVVDAGTVVADVPDAFERIRADGPLTFVSGPSATSDIELTRVRGVHGPRRLEVVIAAQR